jgi:hypothetical protein
MNEEVAHEKIIKMQKQRAGYMRRQTFGQSQT